RSAAPSSSPSTNITCLRVRRECEASMRKANPGTIGSARGQILVANVCLGIAAASCDGWTQSTPRLQRSLDFPVRLPAAGEPTKIMGGSRMVCASRHLADTACFGELFLSMRPIDPAFGEYPFKHFHTRPVSLR